MDQKTFDTIVDNRIEQTKLILKAKGDEYAFDGDRLYNFRRGGEISRESMEKDWFGKYKKHLTSVIDMVEGRLTPTEKLINEKIGDSINYHILLEGILREKHNLLLNKKCIECNECSNGDV